MFYARREPFRTNLDRRRMSKKLTLPVFRKRETPRFCHLVDEPAGGEQANGVCDLERIHNIAVTYFRHADAVLEGRLEDRDHLAVHVID